MPDFTNTFEGGVDDADILAADAGTPNAWDVIRFPTGATVKYTSNPVFSGLMAAKVRSGTTASDAGVEWAQTFGRDFYARFFFRTPVTPTSGGILFNLFSGGAFSGGIGLTTARKLYVARVGYGVGTIALTALPLNQWCRVEAFIHGGTTSDAYITARYYTSPLSSSITETLDTSGTAWTMPTSPNVARMTLGVGAAANSPTVTATDLYYFDKPSVGKTTDWYGPDLSFTNTVVPTVTGPLSVGSTLTANPGTWTPTPSSFNYYWHREDDALGTNLVEIGATGSTYTLSSSDVNKYIRAGVIPVA